MGNYRGKEGKRRKTGRYGWGGMKGNGENVGEDKRKEERNDGGKGMGNGIYGNIVVYVVFDS